MAIVKLKKNNKTPLLCRLKLSQLPGIRMWPILRSIILPTLHSLGWLAGKIHEKACAKGLTQCRVVCRRTEYMLAVILTISSIFSALGQSVSIWALALLLSSSCLIGHGGFWLTHTHTHTGLPLGPGCQDNQGPATSESVEKHMPFTKSRGEWQRS